MRRLSLALVALAAAVPVAGLALLTLAPGSRTAIPDGAPHGHLPVAGTRDTDLDRPAWPAPAAPSPAAELAAPTLDAGRSSSAPGAAAAPASARAVGRSRAGALQGAGATGSSVARGAVAMGRANIMLAAEGSPFDDQAFDTEAYARIAEPGFRRVAHEPLSTFSIDVDTASYSNVRRFLMDMDVLPPVDAVRVEELLNTFRFDDPEPDGDAPFSVATEIASCPWAPEHRLLRIGLRGRSLDAEHLPPRNLVFLVDVSGSMSSPQKLPLVKESLRLLLGALDGRDRVGIVVYAGAAGLVLEPTPADRRDEILAAIEGLTPGGSTHGSQGIQLAYELAERHFVRGGANRVVLCTDGDFNVGVTSEGELVRLIEEKRARGVFLTVLGFGTGNLKDSTMEKLADHGNGNYAYIDTLAEARKVLVDEAAAWLVTIAQDVKIQVELNPGEVEAYRLIGYENRALAAEDFNDDRKDAGEIGAGHAVTALYEIVPAGSEAPGSPVDALRYQHAAPLTNAAQEGETATVKLRWQPPGGGTSQLIAVPVRDSGATWQEASTDFRFAAAVAAFGMALRGSEHAGSASLEMARSLGERSLGGDDGGHRAAFLELVDRASSLSPVDTVRLTTR